jgi:hypothetical protein
VENYPEPEGLSTLEARERYPTNRRIRSGRRNSGRLIATAEHDASSLSARKSDSSRLGTLSIAQLSASAVRVGMGRLTASMLLILLWGKAAQIEEARSVTLQNLQVIEIA